MSRLIKYPARTVIGAGILIPLCFLSNARAAEQPSPLFMRGYTVIPEPQTVQLSQAQFHTYNLEVFLSIAGLYRQNLELLQNLRTINASLQSAETAAGRLKYSDAVAALDQALQRAKVTRAQRNRTLQSVTNTWYKSWYPRVPEANGRRYLLVLNSVQDYRVDRTLGLNYLVQREFLLPFGDWFRQLLNVRNHYAASHELPEAKFDFDWQDGVSTSVGNSY